MKGDGGDVVGVARQRLDAGFILIIPDFDSPVIGAGNQVRFVAARVIRNAIHAFLVTLQGKVGGIRAQLPDLWGNEKVTLNVFVNE